ncbi:TonB-dependent siderophore receptor [Aurantiacibacter gangjinensis]|uniref:TonB-dependent siderophore receptor n=1 Tax=Aurantiacibacter gangjinensis TaxID=502682 RepID=UPI00090AFEF6|nr:TonB-dependent siderophore receptor [Aurantiacibacter gangjinensis]APE27153.1 Ferrichrome-iron receptor [Aurantiacibacter gangjinensis]
MLDFRFVVSASVFTMATAMVNSTQVAAQETEVSEDAEALGEVILVTGVRPAYRGDFEALEIPQAEQIISTQLLEDNNALDLDNALDLSASVARQNNFGGLWNSFAIRGLVGDENLPSGFLVNGFNAGRGFSGPRDLAGIEAVEVLKGPRAALYGRGEPGGTVNLLTKSPRFETAGEILFQAGSYDFYRGDVDLQTTLGSAVGVRFVGFYEDAGSFRDTIETERFGLFPSVAINISDASRLVYELEYTRQELPFDRGVLALNGELGVLPISRFLGEPADGPNITESFGHQVEFQHDFSDSWSALLGFNYRDTSLTGSATEAELSGSRQQLFVDGRTLTRQRRFRDYSGEYYVFRGELTGEFETGGVQHRIIIGADTDRFENDQVFSRVRSRPLSSDPSLQELQALDIFDPQYGRFPLPEPTPLTDRLEIQAATGVYFQYQVSLGERFDLRLGGRYDEFSDEQNNRATNRIFETNDNEFSPQVGAVYRFTPEIAIYATYGENFRSLSGATFDGEPFDPKKAEAFEGGIKFESSDGRLLATATLFSIQQSNILIGDPVNQFFLISAGEASSRGAEFDLQARLFSGTDLWVSYAYVDAQIDEEIIDANFLVPIVPGSRILNVPDHSLNVQLAHTTQVLRRNVRFGGGVLYVSDRLGEVGTDFELPAYTLARLFAEADLTENVAIRLDVDNLFGEEWYPNSLAELRVQPGAPRTVRVGARFSF